LAREQFLSLLRGTRVPELLPGLRALHDEEKRQGSAGSLRRSYIEQRDQRRMAAAGLQRWFEAEATRPGTAPAELGPKASATLSISASTDANVLAALASLEPAKN
ncbi:unnamed protein product, partial [Symbiodinium pilosum]